MNVIAALILGFVIGWLVEWAVDWFFWRPKNEALANDLTDAQTRLQEFESGEGQLESQMATSESAYQELETRNADLEARIAALEAENASLQTEMDTQVATLKDDLQEIYGVGPVVESKLNAAGVFKYRQLADLDADQFRTILGPDSERAVNEEKIIALAGLAARATENVRGDNLQAIRGVGPVIAGLLNQAGIYTYDDVGKMTPEELEGILGDDIEHLADEAEIIAQAQRLAGAGMEGAGTQPDPELQAKVASLETEKSDLLVLVSELRAENEALQGRMDTQIAGLKDDLPDS
jgi:predicted flap endonuclease-1-like 5' DNA nuclease